MQNMADERDKTTERIGRAPSSETKVRLHCASDMSEECKSILLGLAGQLDEIRNDQRAILGRLKAQEEWSSMQRNIASKVGVAVGMAVLSAAGAAALWLYDAMRGIK